MEKTIEIKGIDLRALLGVADSNLKLLEAAFDCKIIVRGNMVKMVGEKDFEAIQEVFHEMSQTLARKGDLSNADVNTLIRTVKNENGQNAHDLERVVHYGLKGAIGARTDGQKTYINLVRENDIVFSIGPAGTGKTFLAVAFAISALQSNEVERIILCRPAVEAGENLGFLPGDLKEKVDPYLAPLYDALNDMLPQASLKPLLNKNIIEIIPLAYMRGRTLNNSFLILDEAQNATSMQMKMFLTRLGINSRAIITGDITQIDLPDKNDSGLRQVMKILKNIDGIGFAALTDNDVVRHKLVRDIILAYGNHSEKR